MILRQVIPAFLGGVLFFFLLALSRAFVPVVMLMDHEGFKANHVTVQAKFTGYKIRNCVVVPGSFIGWAKRGDIWQEVPLTFPNDPSPDSSNPVTIEKQSFGIWRWRVDPTLPHELKMTMQHKCNGKVRTSSFGPFHYVPK